MSDPHVNLPETPVRLVRSIPPFARTSMPPTGPTMWDKPGVQIAYGVITLLAILALDITLAVVK